jgi:hypothetical protein
MTTTDIDLLAIEITRDAEELLAVAAAPDLPAGMVVLPLGGRDDASGSSLGSGHDLALANGCRPGAVAVRVDVAGILRIALTEAADRPGIAIDVARHAAEQIAIHEAAHALIADLDAERSIAEAVARVRAADARPALRDADVHCPRWAAAVVVLAERAIRLRPAEEREDLEWFARKDLRRYGIEAVAVADALGEVADEVRLRELLAADGDAARRVAAVCLPEHERQAVILEHR